MGERGGAVPRLRQRSGHVGPETEAGEVTAPGGRYNTYSMSIRSAIIALATAALLASCGKDPDHSAGPAGPTGPRPHVLLISVDTLRADHLSCYGYERNTSPRIDALAAEGALFETAVSSTSWTLAAHAALLTSLPDSVHGAFRPSDRLTEDRVTLTEVLKENGYRTAGMYSGPFLHPVFGLSQGFDEYISCTSADRNSGTSLEPDQPELRDENNRTSRADIAHEDVTSPAILEEVTGWLDRRGDDDRPFFLFLHMWDPHYNYIPPPPYDTMWDADYTGNVDGRDLWTYPASEKRLPKRDLEHLIALYDGEISFTDHHIGLILDQLEARGLLDDTLVVLTADHGEEFYEHGGYGHHRTLYDESVLVPLIMRYPKSIEAGTRVSSQVRLQDITPTILDLSGAPALELAFGGSLRPFLERQGAERISHRPAFSELYLSNLSALRRPPFKSLDQQLDGQHRRSVFDLENDRRERNQLPDGNDLYRTAVKEHDQLAKQIAALRGLMSDSGSADIPQELLEELRALGYIGDD